MGNSGCLRSMTREECGNLLKYPINGMLVMAGDSLLFRLTGLR